MSEKPQTQLFTISKVTAQLLERFRQDLEHEVGFKIATPEAVAFIIEDYTKSYFASLRG